MYDVVAKLPEELTALAFVVECFPTTLFGNEVLVILKNTFRSAIIVGHLQV